MTATLPPASTTRQRYTWRVVDIVVASVIGVASGVVFWAWQFVWGAASIPLAVLPGLSGLLAGGWLFAGVLGGLVIRKPGAAAFTNLLAAVVSTLFGTEWGWTTPVWGLLEGLGAELVFALFLYRRWNLGVAVLAGMGAGLFVGLLDTNFTSYVALDLGFKTVYVVGAIISGALIAGVLSWLAMRGLARSGALTRFAAGREVSA